MRDWSWQSCWRGSSHLIQSMDSMQLVYWLTASRSHWSQKKSTPAHELSHQHPQWLDRCLHSFWFLEFWLGAGSMQNLSVCLCARLFRYFGAVWMVNGPIWQLRHRQGSNAMLLLLRHRQGSGWCPQHRLALKVPALPLPCWRMHKDYRHCEGAGFMRGGSLFSPGLTFLAHVPLF